MGKLLPQSPAMGIIDGAGGDGCVFVELTKIRLIYLGVNMSLVIGYILFRSMGNAGALQDMRKDI